MQPVAPLAVEDLTAAQSARPFFTFFEVASELHNRAEEVLGEMGLSYREYSFLERLQDARITILPGSEALDGHCGDADAILLDPLEEQGLIRRVRDVAGPMRIELTALGLLRAVEASTRLQELACDFHASFDEVERLRLGRLLNKLAG